MNLRETLEYLRANPGRVATVTVNTISGKVNDMKGPKTIRYNETAGQFEGKRNAEYSKLDQHWTVITNSACTFEFQRA